MHTILVPVDGSKPAKNALKYAISIVKECLAAEIHVINVQPVVLPLGELPLLDADVIEKLQLEQGDKVLKAACSLLHKAGIKYTRHLEIGSIAVTIINYAKSHDCDCIIMGTRGMGTLSSLVLGSISNKIIHLAKIPVMLVK